MRCFARGFAFGTPISLLLWLAIFVVIGVA
jgi:hypothetical protein